ncbi:SDR family NAD(P)-dependent oxidoreductase [Caballeronia sp. 15715]|uniref:SDR family NAD(P)-dependent oxidoreductase n=1 Tax=unclassified Caballeronia TaxID=2646786 RepID=UPI0039E2928C
MTTFVDNKTSLEGKVAIVTGAGSGIGRAAALLLAQRGAKVVVADLKEDGGKETAAIIGTNAVFVKVDVADEASFKSLVDKTLSTFGRLDIAVNNAGIAIGGTEIAESDKETWDKVIGVNLTGMYIAVRAEVAAMLKTGGGSIVNMSSVAGVVAQVGQVAYITSKHGVIGVTKAAAIEYSGRGIRVNAILPGTINTPMVQKIVAENPGWVEKLTAGQPIQRLGEPDEIAEAIAWLASDAASFVTGASIAVDGGFIAQ